MIANSSHDECGKYRSRKVSNLGFHHIVVNCVVSTNISYFRILNYLIK